jgi:MHS family proline/betaine transporter-like MFS transporter
LRSPASQSYKIRRVLISAALGQFVEWYDFAIYAYSAPVIAKLFFPPGDRFTSLLATFAVYAVGFLMRPFGGVIFGGLGDRFGRRIALSFVILSMGAATFIIGLLPSYANIGLAAPICLSICRLLQGLSAAGEAVGSNSFVAEHVASERRGFCVAFTHAFGALSPVFAAVLILILTNSLRPEVYIIWGWRIPFIIGGPIALIGLYIRSKVEESPAFEVTNAAKRLTRYPILTAVNKHRSKMILSFALAAFSSLSFYTLSGYLVTYLTTTVELDQNTALISNCVALFVSFLSMSGGGWLSDKYGRKPILLLGLIGSFVILVPAFMILGHATLFSAIVGQVLLALTFGVYWGAVGVTLIELFPTRSRFTASAISYNLAFAIFGGTTPFISIWLVAKSGNKLSPAIYMAVIPIFVLLAILRMPETSKTSLVHDEDIKQPEPSA